MDDNKILNKDNDVICYFTDNNKKYAGYLAYLMNINKDGSHIKADLLDKIMINGNLLSNINIKDYEIAEFISSNDKDTNKNLLNLIIKTLKIW